jgi:hypothetical protein
VGDAITTAGGCESVVAVWSAFSTAAVALTRPYPNCWSSPVAPRSWAVVKTMLSSDADESVGLALMRSP